MWLHFKDFDFKDIAHISGHLLGKWNHIPRVFMTPLQLWDLMGDSALGIKMPEQS